MGTEIACSSSTRLVLIDCKRSQDGLYWHAAFDGTKRIANAGFEAILHPAYIEQMRVAPLSFLAWCKS